MTKATLTISSKTYSAWSLRGWLAARQAGLAFDLEVVPLFGSDPAADHRAHPALAPSAGRVPILWDGDAVVWDSLAIMDYLADKVGRDRFWPKQEAARALARAMVAEMHSGFAPLRRALPMDLQRPPAPLDPAACHQPDAVEGDILRVLALWAEARSRFGAGGPFLFGSFGAADIAFAPVVARFHHYAVPVPGFAQAYMAAVWEHAWLREWAAGAAEETWVIPG